MPAFLSDEWLAALDAAARADEQLQAAAAEADLVVQQVVVDGDHEVAYVVVLAADEVSVRPGRAEAPTVTITQDRHTAEAVAAGDRSALQAFIDGEVRVRGDVVALAGRHKALARLGDVFASVRSDTTGIAGRPPS